MACINVPPILSVVLPTPNEASRLPLLLADLHQWPFSIELLVVDCGSTDKTRTVARLSRAKVLRTPSPNRGAQLRKGASLACGTWLLFLHADSRLPAKWPILIKKTITKPAAHKKGWFFDFRIKGKRFDYRLLEIAVAIRSNFGKQPYGDQGLLISRSLYNKLGGFSPIHLMEDIDFVERISTESQMGRIGLPIYTDGKKWSNINIFIRALKNARLRKRWRQGEVSSILQKEYYDESE